MRGGMVEVTDRAGDGLDLRAAAFVRADRGGRSVVGPGRGAPSIGGGVHAPPPDGGGNSTTEGGGTGTWGDGDADGDGGAQRADGPSRSSSSAGPSAGWSRTAAASIPRKTVPSTRCKKSNSSAAGVSNDGGVHGDGPSERLSLGEHLCAHRVEPLVDLSDRRRWQGVEVEHRLDRARAVVSPTEHHLCSGVDEQLLPGVVARQREVGALARGCRGHGDAVPRTRRRVARPSAT